jgi:hypothetical protein
MYSIPLNVSTTVQRQKEAGRGPATLLPLNFFGSIAFMTIDDCHYLT